MIRRDGIRMFNLHYWDNVLSPLAGRSQQRFIVKYDPRDLSRVYLRDEKGDYWTIPYRDLGAPPITLWEHRNALRKLSADGLQECRRKADLSNDRGATRTHRRSQTANADGAIGARAQHRGGIEVRIGRTCLRSAESERVLPKARVVSNASIARPI